MDAQQVIATLRRNEPALRQRGICHAALFGSVARGDDRPDSDIDILVEFHPDLRMTIFDYVAIKRYVAELFDQPVDVVSPERLKQHLKQPSLRDALYAF